jgi:hypothetical protein
VPSDAVGEIGRGMRPVFDVCGECGIGTPDVECRRAFEAGQRGPLLSKRRWDGKLDGLAAAARSRDPQGEDLGFMPTAMASRCWRR